MAEASHMLGVVETHGNELDGPSFAVVGYPNPYIDETTFPDAPRVSSVLIRNRGELGDLFSRILRLMDDRQLDEAFDLVRRTMQRRGVDVDVYLVSREENNKK